MSFLYTFWSVFANAVLWSTLSVIFLASIGKSFGVRKIYLSLLLKIFEYGRQNIEKVKSLNHRHDADADASTDAADQSNGTADTPSDDDDDDDSTEQQQQTIGNETSSTPLTNGIKSKLKSHSSNNNLIKRDTLILVPDGKDSITNRRVTDDDHAEHLVEFDLSNCLDYVKSGVEAIIEDDVTSRFEAEELKNWNLLTRTNRFYEFISWRLSIIWVFGFIVRYVILMPIRVFVCFIGVWWMVFSFAVVGMVPFKDARRRLNDFTFKISFRIISRSISSFVRFHNKEYRPRNCGFCVANHTTPVDIAILSTDCSYSLIGQSHGGFLGLLQRALARASPHIWFERAESKDRMAVAARLRQHVSDPNNPPILIFPEGTCINNTSVMQFKKGSFEVGGVIYPVAIKYDPRFGDPFWNSSKYSMMQYLFLMMTSWAIVCDVWYLPPMYQQQDESAIVFANRVKSVIAKQGGLIDLVWDGNLKRNKPKNEWKEKQQEVFTKRLKGE